MTGIIESAATGDPLEAALVHVLGTWKATFTDESGHFSLTGLESGAQVLIVRRIGFRPLEVVVDLLEGQTLEISAGTLAIEPLPVALPGVIVEGRHARWVRSLERSGFYERERTGFGYFVDHDRIAEWKPLGLTETLRRAPGVRVLPNPIYGRRRTPFGVGHTRRLVGEMERSSFRCEPGLFLDGMHLGTTGGFDLDGLITAAQLAGFEVYSSATETSLRFSNGSGTCGAIVLWTR